MTNAIETKHVPDALRQAYQSHHLAPLWESPTAHKLDMEREKTQLWAWADMEPIIAGTAKIGSPEVVERRVLSLVNRKSKSPEDEATCGLVNACYQSLLPGERARPHRHSMNALRFVLSGEGAKTIVDGKECPMEYGDLVITPAWTWHEHVHDGEGQFIWLDVLDVALHLQLGTDAFQPGPVNEMPPRLADSVYGTANILPVRYDELQGYSPVFRYAYGDTAKALAKAPAGPDGARRIRYSNPTTGGPAMTMLDCTMMALDGGTETSRPFRSSASTVCCVVKGEGKSVIGGETIKWKQRDVFTLPSNDWATHRALSDAEIFMVSNRDVYRQLGLLKEEFGE